jgi:RNA polymerase sigma factor (sigma-70 family)
MNFVPDAPLRKTTPTNAPATIIPTDVRRAGRVSLIFEQKYEHFCFLAFKYVTSMDDAKDIVANVFEGALRNWPTERYEAILNLEAYMYRAVRNSAINVAKRKKYLISIHDFPIDTFSISNPMEKFDLNLDAFIKLLPNKQREAFNLFSQGYSHKEIAAQLNLDSEGASKNLIYYAKKNLKKLISDLPEFDPDDRGPFNSGRYKAKKHNAPNRRALNINPGSTPKVKDLLSFISGGALKESNKRTILQWLVNQNAAFEIVSGLQIALKNNSAINIEANIRKDKNSLRTQLFGKPIKNPVNNTPHTNSISLESIFSNFQAPHPNFYNANCINSELLLWNFLKIEQENNE